MLVYQPSSDELSSEAKIQPGPRDDQHSESVQTIAGARHKLLRSLRQRTVTKKYKY